jgi:transaldolase
MNRLEQLHHASVSICLDALSRERVWRRLRDADSDCAVSGATSNPTIFAKATTGSDRYDNQLPADSDVRDCVAIPKPGCIEARVQRTVLAS